MNFPEDLPEEEEEMLFHNLSGPQIHPEFENFPEAPQGSVNNTMHVQQEQHIIVEEDEQQI